VTESNHELKKVAREPLDRSLRSERDLTEEEWAANPAHQAQAGSPLGRNSLRKAAVRTACWTLDLLAGEMIKLTDHEQLSPGFRSEAQRG
jgi:hypothetical protein